MKGTNGNKGVILLPVSRSSTITGQQKDGSLFRPSANWPKAGQTDFVSQLSVSVVLPEALLQGPDCRESPAETLLIFEAY